MLDRVENKMQTQAITHDNLIVSGIPFLTTLLDVQICVLPNEHGKMIIRGYGDAAETISNIEQKFFGQAVELIHKENPDSPIFSGIITQYKLISEHDVNRLEITILTGSYLLDTDRKSRSFQDISMTYEDVVREVLLDTNGAGIFSVGKDVPIGSPIIQYLETDWEFIKRLASHFNSPVIADVTVPKVNIWFGISKHGENATFENIHFKVGVSQNYYTEDGRSSGLTPTDFVYFKVRSTQDYNIGDNGEINGTTIKICEKHACFKRAMLEFDYTLGKPGLISKRKVFNEKAIGMSLKGKVTQTDAETVNVHLDIDDDDNSDYSFKWTPTTGNLMYAMPIVGTQVSLLLPNEDERCAMATNSPRDEEASVACSGMDDFNLRAFTTEHDKRMLIFPDKMSFIAGSEEKPVLFRLDDLEKMLFHSYHDISIIAKGDIEFVAPTVIFAIRPQEKYINIMRTISATMFESLIVAIGSASMLPFSQSGDDEEIFESDNKGSETVIPDDFTVLILHSRFDVTGDHGIFQARIYGEHYRFDDAPREGEFSLARSIFRAVVVGIVVAAVAVAVIATGGLAVAGLAVLGSKIFVGAIGGAVLGASLAAVGVLVHDVRSGNNSTWAQFVRAVAIGALVGAIGGGFSAKKKLLVEALKAKKLKLAAFKKSLNYSIASGVSTSVASTTVNGLIDGNLTFNDLWRSTLRGVGSGLISFGMEGTISALAEKLHMCPGTFLRKLDGSRGVNPNAVPGVLARRFSNAIIGGLDNSLTSAISNAFMDTGGNIFNSILTGETFDSFAAGQSAFNAGRENFIEDFITGAASGMFRGDPVNAVYGFVYYNTVDFEYPGVIPLVWKRSWSSRNIAQKPSHFGCGSGFSYGVYLIIENDGIAFVDSNGQGTRFNHLKSNEICTNRKSKMTLAFDENSESYEIFNYEERLYYKFEHKPNTSIYNLMKIETETREHRITLKYDALHNLSSIIDTAGRVFDVITTRMGQITQVQYSGKILSQYVYDSNLDLVQRVDVNNKSAHFEYDKHLLVKRTSMEGDIFIWKYIGEGHSAKCVYTTGEDRFLEYWFEYYEDHTIVINSLGHKEILHFSEDRMLEKITHQNGYTTIYEHSKYGEITSIINADGESVKISYNDFGQPTEMTQPNGAVHKIEYDERGRVIKCIAPLSIENTWIYDEMGRIYQSISPTGEITTYTYGENGLLAELTTRENQLELKTSIQYDKALNITQISYANNSIETMEYDDEGNCIKATSRLGAVNIMNYDKSNRLIRFTSDDGNTTNFKYNAYNDMVWIKDSEQEIRFAYNPLGSITSRTEQHRKINFDYDTENQLSCITNESREDYSFERDSMGRVVTEKGYDGVRKSYIYTPAGKMKGIKRGNTANWIFMQYGKDGFLSKVIYDNGSLTGETEEEVFTYGIRGELLSARNKYSVLRFEYDKLGNLTKEMQNEHSVESTYSTDHAFKRVNLKTSIGLNVDTILNKFGQVKNISASFDLNTTNRTTQYSSEESTGDIWQASHTYNIVGQLLERTISMNTGTKIPQSEIKDSWSYDYYGRPMLQGTCINQRESSKRQYTWGTAHKLESIIDDITNMGLEYSYDIFGYPQKETLKGTKTQETIRYLDDVGQVYETRSKIDRKYDKGGQLILSKHRKYIYNDCGDLVEKIEANGEIWKYIYHFCGLLQKVIRPDGKSVTFTYDALARRISKVFDGMTTRYVWDGNKMVHEWMEINNTPEVIPTITPISTWIFENESFTPIAKLIGANVYTIINNHIGTPTKMIDSNGNNVWDKTFDIWGREHSENHTKTIGKTKIVLTGFKSNFPECFTHEAYMPFRFPGQYEDIETGLYYNRFRYYMPDEGIYTQRDPIGLFGGNPTVYGYVRNTLNSIDPFGLAINLIGLPPIDSGSGGASAVMHLPNLPVTPNLLDSGFVNGFSGGTMINGSQVTDPINTLFGTYGNTHNLVLGLYVLAGMSDIDNIGLNLPGLSWCAEVAILSRIAFAHNLPKTVDGFMALRSFVQGGTSIAVDNSTGDFKRACLACQWVLSELGILFPDFTGRENEANRFIEENCRITGS